MVRTRWYWRKSFKPKDGVAANTAEATIKVSFFILTVIRPFLFRARENATIRPKLSGWLDSKLKGNKNLHAIPVRPIPPVMISVPVVMMMMPMTMMPIVFTGSRFRAWRRGKHRTEQCEGEDQYFHIFSLYGSQKECQPDLKSLQLRSRSLECAEFFGFS